MICKAGMEAHDLEANGGSGRLRTARAWATAAAVLLVASCGTNRGIAEFEAYRFAYDAAAETGESILDRLAAAEREINDLLDPPPTKATQVTFDPNKAAYYSKAVDPPATAAYRRALQAVRAYNDALYGLASGETAAALAAKVSAISGLVASAPGEIAGPTGAAVGATFTAAANAVNAAVKGLEPLTAAVIGFEARDQFQSRLLEEAGTMDGILLTMRTKTTDIFDALFAPTVFEANDSFERGGQLRPEETEKIVAVRELLANWVVLLDGSRVALDAAVTAVADESSGGLVTGLIVTSMELSGAARDSRRNLAESF